MSKYVAFYLYAEDCYENGIFVTRYFLGETGKEINLIGRPEGIENTIKLIFKTIKDFDLFTQEIIFKDPHNYKDRLRVQIPTLPLPGDCVIRSRPLNEEEKKEFCSVLSKLTYAEAKKQETN